MVPHGIGSGCITAWAEPAARKTAEQAHRLHEEWGFTAFKTSPYRLDPEADPWGRVCAAAADYFAELREHTDAGWEFAFDPHAKILEPVRALQLANALAPFDPYFPDSASRSTRPALRGDRHVHRVRPAVFRPDGSTGYI